MTGRQVFAGLIAICIQPYVLPGVSAANRSSTTFTKS